eukprot:m.184654 g.184654  ORF g.184654 m.184654 type:complete len:462 (+) comp15017_c0_seq2:161-1546(+)
MDLIASDVGLNLTGCDELLGLDILGFGTMAKLAARRRRKRRMLIAILLDVDPAALEKLVTYEVNQQLLLMDLRGGSRPGRKKKKVPRHKKPCTWPELYLSGTYYDERQFREVFAVPKIVFEEVHKAIGVAIHRGADCTKMKGMGSDVAVLTMLRMLRSGVACVQMEDQVGFSKQVVHDRFLEALGLVVEKLGPRFLQSMPPERLDKELTLSALSNFPGCLGCVDCFHATRVCSKRAQGITRGRHGNTNSSVQVVAGSDLYVLDVHVNEHGSDNDINTLWSSQIFQDFIEARFTDSFHVAGEQFDMQYLMADSIYPKYAMIVRGKLGARTAAEKKYNENLESHRKCVECAIGCLQSRFAMIRKGHCIRYRDPEVTTKIVQVCCILHNMILDLHGYFNAPHCLGTANQPLTAEEYAMEFLDADFSRERDTGLMYGNERDAGAVASKSEHLRLQKALIKLRGYA